jgi:hypothetical protein
MPVSTKLNLLILVLPISSIVLVFLVGFYFYRSSFNASAFATAVSSLTSAILVILLVWERLRDSLSKKFEYIHKNFLFKLFSKLPYPDLFWSQGIEEIRTLRSNLERYANFLGLKLYPKNLIDDINKFLALHYQFFKRYEEIEKLAMKEIGKGNVNLHRDLLQHYLGFERAYSSINPAIEKIFKETAEAITKENPQKLTEAKEYLQKTTESIAPIYTELEDFLKSNNLRLEQESTPSWS